jgi:putative transposase
VRKSKYTDHQITKTLEEVEAGRAVRDACRELGISAATCYAWTRTFGGTEASNVRGRRNLKRYNAQLEPIFAEMALETNALNELIGKKCLDRSGFAS